MRPRKANRHLPPCVYLRHSRYWHVVKGKWHSLGTDLPGALAEYARRVVAEPTDKGMPRLVDRVVADLSPRWSDSTRRQNAYAAKILKRKLAEFEPHEVKGKHCASVKQSLSNTPNMANRVMSLLRQVFSQAVEWQEIDSNPCIGISRLPEAKRKRLLSAQEWAAIYEAAGPRLRVIMRLQYLTGQRISDVLSIRRNQLTEDGIAFAQQKTGARLLVRWSPELRAAVAEANALTIHAPALTLLRGKHGKAPDYRSVALQFKEAATAAGVSDAKLNDARAMSATAANRQGRNAQALLGHTSAAMTKRYLRERETPEVDGPSIEQVLNVGQKR